MICRKDEKRSLKDIHTIPLYIILYRYCHGVRLALSLKVGRTRVCKHYVGCSYLRRLGIS